MSKLEKALEFYSKTKQNFFNDVSIYLQHGFVYSDPDSIALAKPVKMDDGDPTNKWIHSSQADAWYVHFALGENSLKKMCDKIPFKLSHIGFSRVLKNKEIKYYKSENFFRRIK